nr:hypothetical protein CFP56_76385 [Quercus suber]
MLQVFNQQTGPSLRALPYGSMGNAVFVGPMFFKRSLSQDAGSNEDDAGRYRGKSGTATTMEGGNVVQELPKTVHDRIEMRQEYVTSVTDSRGYAIESSLMPKSGPNMDGNSKVNMGKSKSLKCQPIIGDSSQVNSPANSDSEVTRDTHDSSPFNAAFMDFKELLSTSWMIRTKQKKESFSVMIWIIGTHWIRVRTNQPCCIPNQHTGWTPPVNHMFKVNFDKAIFREEQKAGVGVIIRDEHGSVIASMADSISLPFSVDAVEAFAAKEALAEEIEVLAALNALSFTFELGFRSTISKGDSLGLTQALKSEERSLSPTEF